MADVAVLGTGRMGSAMAQRVAGAGHHVTLWNRTEATARVLAESMPAAAVTVAPTPAAAVQDQDVILSVLADGDATRAVLLDPVTQIPILAGSGPADSDSVIFVLARNFTVLPPGH